MPDIISGERTRSEFRTLALLRQEHETIRAFLRAVRRLHVTSRPEGLPDEAAEAIRSFATDFVEGFHHTREEAGVYDVFTSKTGVDLMQDTPLGGQRESLRDYLEGMRWALDGATPGGAVLFAWNTAAFARTLEAHLRDEETIAHAALRDWLTPHRDEILAERVSADTPYAVEAAVHAEHVTRLLTSLDG